MFINSDSNLQKFIRSYSLVEKNMDFRYHLCPAWRIKQKQNEMWFTDFFSLVYPRICACCGNSLWEKEEVICRICEYHLPKTNDYLEWINPVSKLFWGRARIHAAAAFLLFNKGNKVQKLMHQLKYKGRKDIGVYLGAQFGNLLKYSVFFNEINLIIPVPLHKKKIMKRGYNQSEQFAIGLSASMKIPVSTDCLFRIKESETQTKKSRYARWQNVYEIFSVRNTDRFKGSKILLVDDVITTGATLESCIQALNNIPDVCVSIGVIAFAKH
jgi:ComF family protein